MQRNALQDLNAIDAAMASVGTGELLGIDVSPTRLGTHARLRNTMRKREKHEPINSGISGMIEPFESRMLPSTLLHPLTDSSFAMTLKNGATMTDDVFQTNGGTAEIASNETLDFGSGDFTVSASVQFQRNGEIEMIAFKNAREPRSKGFGLWRTNNGTINAMLNDGNGNYLTLNSVGSISDTTGFHEISMVRKNDILSLWIDGTEQQTRVLEGAQGHYDITSPAPLIVGRTDNGYYQLEAKIKELILTKGAFTPAEMTELQKAASSPAVSQETANIIAETVVEQQKVQTQIETYTEPEFVSFSSVPNGLYAPGQFHTVNLTPEIKIRLYSDNMFEVDNGTIVPTGSGNDWIHVSLAEGQSPIPVSSVRVRYNPYGGGAAGTLNVLSGDDQNRVMKLSQEGDIPVTGPVKRVLYTLEGHKGALLGMTLDVTKTREIVVPIIEEPAETVEGISEETLTTIAEVVASQEQKMTVETSTANLVKPLTDSAFAMTLKSGATMADDIFQTNSGIAEIVSHEALNFGSGDFTISASVQFQRNNEIEMILFKIARGANTQGYGLRKMNDNTIQGLLCDGKGNFLALNSVGKITDTTGFHDISMVRKNDILGLWIDGVEQQTKIIEGAQGHYDITNPAPLIVGRTDDGYYQLEAKIRELVVTPGAFTPTEISELQKAALSTAISQETVDVIAEVVASQEAEAIMGPEASEMIDEHAPLLRIVGIQGSNITLAASSPMTGGNSVRFLNLQDDGLFTNTVIEGVTDGSITPVSLGMNAANGTGNYRIVLTGGPNGSTLASVEVHWDRDSKTLSLAGSEKLWECSEQIGKVMNAQTQEVLALAKNPMVGSGVLQAMQQESLIDGVRSLPSSGLNIPEFESAFWNAHPEWKDDAIHETAIRESKTTRYTATQIYDRIVTQRNDTLSILRDAYGRYLSQLGDLLQEGVRVLSAVRNGGHEPDIRRNFAILVDQIATNLTMYKLSDINIRIPDGNTLLESVKSVWTTRCEELISFKTGETKLAAQQTYRAQLVANLPIELPDGTRVAADDPRASTAVVYRMDDSGRLTILPQAVTQTASTQTNSTALIADINNTQIALSKEHLYLTVGAGKGVPDAQQLSVQPGKASLIELDINEEKMVSFAVAGIPGRNLTLRLTGTGLPPEGYVSEKAVTAGESVSLRLGSGHYKLVVQDNTDYTNFLLAPFAYQSFPVSVETNIKPYNSAKIEGLISIEGNDKVMPVSMSVAEFDNAGQRKTDYKTSGENAISKLNTNQSVTVVFHGRSDNERSDQIEELVKNLTIAGKQVVTVDWSKAAADFVKLPISLPFIGDDFGDLRDASWTPAVGKWVANQLMHAGFSPEKIEAEGHSHGAYGAFFMAEEIKKVTGNEINCLIALDPALNPWFANNSISSSDINFKSVVNNSWAIVSSDLGDEEMADTAQNYIEVASQNRHAITPQEAIKAHGYAVTLASDLIARSMEIDPVLRLSNIFSGTGLIGIAKKIGAEAIISVNLYHSTRSDGSDWTKASYSRFNPVAYEA